MSKLTVAGSILAAILCSCAGEQAIDSKESSVAEENVVTREEELRRRLEIRQRVGRRFPEQPVEEPSVHVTGEVPDATLEAVKQDLAKRLGASVDEFEVIKAESITWKDGSLGCPTPGQNYTQALVPGYWIVIARGDEEYDYRASETGYFFLCELPMTLTPRNETQ